MAPDPNCERCGETETMEHLLYECDHYSAPLWAEVGATLTATFRHKTGVFASRIDLTPKEIIYNVPHRSIQLYITDKTSRLALIALVHEIKRDILYRRMNITTPLAEPVPAIRIQSHIIANITKLKSMLEYQGKTNNNESLALLNMMIEQQQIRIV